jgi:uncharacterized protein YbjT (DUF2867 family)
VKTLLTGATGFVGRHLRPALALRGHAVRCGSRQPDAAAAEDAGAAEWVALDVEQPDSARAALEGCSAAFFLIHSMGSGADYARREEAGAKAFRDAAAEAGLERIVYLGAAQPHGVPSHHLESRIRVGEILRAGPVPAVELRAGMIVGAGSQSWQMVFDLARRLPMMVLPRWLKYHSQPVAIDDIIVALVRALEMPLEDSACLDVPGPEVVSHRDLLLRVAAQLGRRPLMIDVPVLTPRLSSYWIFAFTRARPAIARELVDGLRADLIAPDDGIFAKLPGYQRVPLDEAIADAIADETRGDWPTAGSLERILLRVSEIPTSGSA